MDRHVKMTAAIVVAVIVGSLFGLLGSTVVGILDPLDRLVGAALAAIGTGFISVLSKGVWNWVENSTSSVQFPRRTGLGFLIGIVFIMMSATLKPPDQSNTVDDASFLYDLRPSDDEVLAPNQMFDKGWRMYNKGNTTWQRYELRRVPNRGTIGPDGINVQEVRAGDDATFTIPGIVAPSKPGCYRSEYKLYSRTRARYFGELIWLQIVVDPSGKSPVQDYGLLVDDMNIRPGTVMSPNQGFIKEWRLHNCGDNDWINYKVRRLGGTLVPPQAPSQVPVPVISGHQDLLLGIEMKAPPSVGTYQAVYTLETPAGSTIVDEFRVSIVVK